MLIHPFFLPWIFFTVRVKKKENDKDDDIKEEEREPKDRRCFQCGDVGHVRRDCPEYRHLKQRTAGVPGVYWRKPRKIFLMLKFFAVSLIHILRYINLTCIKLPSLISSSPAPHIVRTIVSSQSIPIPQVSADDPGRARQPSECVSTKSFHSGLSNRSLLINSMAARYPSVVIM